MVWLSDFDKKWWFSPLYHWDIGLIKSMKSKVWIKWFTWRSGSLKSPGPQARWKRNRLFTTLSIKISPLFSLYWLLHIDPTPTKLPQLRPPPPFRATNLFNTWLLCSSLTWNYVDLVQALEDKTRNKAVLRIHNNTVANAHISRVSS